MALVPKDVGGVTFWWDSEAGAWLWDLPDYTGPLERLPPAGTPGLATGGARPGLTPEQIAGGWAIDPLTGEVLSPALAALLGAREQRDWQTGESALDRAQRQALAEMEAASRAQATAAQAAGEQARARATVQAAGIGAGATIQAAATDAAARVQAAKIAASAALEEARITTGAQKEIAEMNARAAMARLDKELANQQRIEAMRMSIEVARMYSATGLKEYLGGAYWLAGQGPRPQIVNPYQFVPGAEQVQLAPELLGAGLFGQLGPAPVGAGVG